MEVGDHSNVTPTKYRRVRCDDEGFEVYFIQALAVALVWTASTERNDLALVISLHVDELLTMTTRIGIVPSSRCRELTCHISELG